MNLHEEGAALGELDSEWGGPGLYPSAWYHTAGATPAGYINNIFLLIFFFKMFPSRKMSPGVWKNKTVAAGKTN